MVEDHGLRNPHLVTHRLCNIPGPQCPHLWAQIIVPVLSDAVTLSIAVPVECLAQSKEKTLVGQFSSQLSYPERQAHLSGPLSLVPNRDC